ncbi:hypothetical protein [Paraburkholderia bannensis]|uniref:hypothetical protein n=1 Tax=Paraburkholderia bannensis TaxID=765414 RepID=UPI002AB71D09|nr:hypothetical protein [Paraburkholderia bannensis]
MKLAHESMAASRGHSPLRIALRLAGAFIATWVILALYWSANPHEPSGKELLLNGIGVPLLLLIGIAAIRKALAPTHRPAVASKTADAHSGAASAVELAATTTAVASTALLDASMRLPAGMTVEAVLAQAGDGKVVGLHSKLQRLDGSKAFAACAASIWHGDFEGGLQALDVDTALSDEQRRAMLLAAETIDELMARHATTPVEPANDAPSAPPFKLRLLLPERWRADAPTIAAWLDRHLQRGHWRPSVEPVTTVFAAHGLAALAALDTLNVELAQQRAPIRHILLACDSSLGQRTVDALDGAGRLFAHNRPDGEVLGEGACALLLAPSTTADATAAPQVQRLATATREASNEPQRDTTLARLLQTAFAQSARAGLNLNACALASDADQRVSHRAEMSDAARQTWPDPDAGSGARCRHLGLANGAGNAALALATVAAAAAHSAQTQQATFAVSVSDAWERGALLVIPPTPL